jgi:hypothetical protein
MSRSGCYHRNFTVRPVFDEIEQQRAAADVHAPSRCRSGYHGPCHDDVACSTRKTEGSRSIQEIVNSVMNRVNPYSPNRFPSRFENLYACWTFPTVLTSARPLQDHRYDRPVAATSGLGKGTSVGSINRCFSQQHVRCTPRRPSPARPVYLPKFPELSTEIRVHRASFCLRRIAVASCPGSGSRPAQREPAGPSPLSSCVWHPLRQYSSSRMPPPGDSDGAVEERRGWGLDGGDVGHARRTLFVQATATAAAV